MPSVDPRILRELHLSSHMIRHDDDRDRDDTFAVTDDMILGRFPANDVIA
jgi:hypothetical protein